MMKAKSIASALIAAALVWGCGEKTPPKSPSPPVDASAEGGEQEDGEVLIDELKFTEIQSTLDKKASSISLCHPVAVEAGEIEGEDKVSITVGFMIQPDGTPKNVSVLEQSKESAALKKCAVETVSQWSFTTLPRPLEMSHSYTLQSY